MVAPHMSAFGGKADIDNEKIYNCRKHDQLLCDQWTTQCHFNR